MKKSLNLLFWGYIFVYLRIGFPIDVLPAPLGYLFIALGCYKLQEKFSIEGIAGPLSTIMIFVSLPTVFIDVHQEPGWEFFSNVLIVLNLILVYFIFTLLQFVVKRFDNDQLIKRVNHIFNTYIIVHLIYLAYVSVSVNLPQDISLTAYIALTITALVMSIAFLSLIKSIRKTIPIT